MSTLTGNKISLTYKSLIKTADNDVLGAALKELSDGLGNNSGVFLNTGGDLKSTGILEFANFKGTSTSVTINKLVNEADGISNNDNDTSLATSAAVKDYVDTHVTTQDLDFSDGTNPGAVDLDSQVFAIVGTSNEIETSASGQQLQIGLPNDVTISGTYTGTTFSGDLSGTINTATTATTQTAGDNSTKVATTAYVDTLDAASDLDFSDGSTNSAVNLNTQVLSIEGTSKEITTTASGQSLTVSLDSTGVDLPDNTTAITQTAGDNSTKVATTAYVDVLDAASDLDIAGDTGTGDVNLNTQTLTLQGTTNQVTTAVSGQTTTFSLPSTVHRNLQGDVTGDLTGNSAGTHTGAVIGNVTGNVNGDVTGSLIGNADTATAWETARDLILSSEATGTISNVDGTQNVTGAVTLLNSAVTGKVLTGLPTPSAGNIQASDTILEAFGKLQSQVSSISNGLIFKGSWDAATNTPTLTSGGGEVDQGTTTGQAANKLIDTSQNFNVTVSVGDKVINQVDGQSALVTVIDSNTQLSLDADIMLSSEAYTIDASPFIQQGQYYVVNYAGTTNLNGITDWSIGDWVIADADNRWSKLDHSQVDGQGSIGHLPVWTTANTLGDSIVSESGTALTVTGSLDTTLGASVTGDFAVNTNKFTVAAASGNTNIAGTTIINDTLYLTEYIQHLGNTSNNIRFTTDAIAISANATFGGTVISGNDIFVPQDKGIFFNGASDFSSGIAGTSAGQGVRIFAGGSAKVTIDSSGNSTFAGAVNINGGLTVSPNTAGKDTFTLTTNAANDGRLLIKSVDTVKVDIQANGDSYLNGGNVGIGTDSPDRKLTIGNGNGFVNNQISLLDGGGTEQATIAVETTTANDLLVASKTNLRFFTGSTIGGSTTLPTNERMRIDSSGVSTFKNNVNIVASNSTTGSSVSPKMLIYNEGAGDSALQLAVSGSISYYLGVDNSDNTFKIGDASWDSSPFMAIDTSGNSTFTNRVSAGESFNSVKDGADTVADGPFFALKNAAGTRQYINQLDASNNIDYWYYNGSTWTQTISLLNDGGATFAGQVSVAFSNPDVSGIKLQATTGTNAASIMITNTGGNFYIGKDKSDGSRISGTAYANAIWAENANPLVFGVSNSEKMRIDSSGTTTITNGTNDNTLLLLNGARGRRLRFQEHNVGNGGFEITSQDTSESGTTNLNNRTILLNKSGGNIGIGAYPNANSSLHIANPNADTTRFTLSAESNTANYSYIKSVDNTSNTNKMIFGNTYGYNTETDIMTLFNQSVGIGTTSPGTYKLNVAGTALFSGAVEMAGGAAVYQGTKFWLDGGGDTYLESPSSNIMTFTTGGSERMRITSGGNVECVTDNAQNLGSSFLRWSTVYAANGVNTSDETLKENIKECDLGIDFINSLKPKSYNFKDLKEDNDAYGKKRYGLIAQDLLQTELKDSVFGKKDGEYGVSYNDLIAPMVKAIQELKAEVDLLKQECKCK